MKVAVLGASPKPDRYSNLAVRRLAAAGHTVFPVNPAATEICGLAAFARLADIGGRPDIVTVYVGPSRIVPLIPELVAARPGRVILNPGAESPELEAALDAAGIPWIHACTLVMLSTGAL